MRLRKKHFAIPEMKENPKVYFDGYKHKGNWREVFGNDNEVQLEIGSGKGQFITEIAMRNRDVNYIGIDMETNALVYASRKIHEEELDNVRLLPLRAEKLEDYFAEDEISKIYINFCNPWPKNKQHKRRLTHPRFLEIYKKFLKSGATLELKTDDLDFFEDTLEYAEECALETLVCERDMKLEDYPENIVTEYEAKWRSREIPIKYAVFKF
ncbi:MAG: tRNA (guanosine(46)-N7)-methyltransferase TrmB [Peptoniphilus sp.]|nr:tRNA (guanosine(46)-N7)-methyltransferase TrmB [Peptoniphilus sp.]